MQISEITLSDLEEIKELQPDNWSDILIPIRFYIESVFCKPIKIKSSNKIIGIGASLLHKSSAWLAHIIVHPEERSKGIGGLIIQTLLEELKRQKISSVSLIATIAGEPLYEKYNFKKETDYLFFKNENYSLQKLENNLIRDSAVQYYKDILLLDKKISGEDRTLLLTPHLANAKVFVENNTISGFYMPTLGEGLLLAEDNDIGIELLKLRLEKQPIIVLPIENNVAIKFLLENRFCQFQKGTRMILGDRIDFKSKMIYSRIGGNFG